MGSETSRTKTIKLDKNNIKEVNTNKVIYQTNKDAECKALYFDQDIAQQCFEILNDIHEKQQSSGACVNYYKSHIIVIRNENEFQAYSSKRATPTSLGWNVIL